MNTQVDELEEKGRALGVPEHVLGALVRYFVYRLRPGGYTSALLANDLRTCVARGDEEAVAGLAATVRFLERCAPEGSWGSWPKLGAWLAQSSLEEST